MTQPKKPARRRKHANGRVELLEVTVQPTVVIITDSGVEKRSLSPASIPASVWSQFAAEGFDQHIAALQAELDSLA